MKRKKFKYLNGFNTLNNQKFTFLKECLKDKKERKTEIPSSPRIIQNNKNIIMNDNNDNNRTVTSTTDSTIDNSKKHYIYRKNVIKQKNKICIYRNTKNFIDENNIQKNFKNHLTRCSSSENLKINQSVLENTEVHKNNLEKFNNEKNKNYLKKNIFEKNNNCNINKVNNNFYNGRRHISMNEASNEIVNKSNSGTYAYEDGFKKDFINIEDLLLFDDKFNDVLKSINEKFNISNECFELINFYNTSSLHNKFEQYFLDPKISAIIHTSIMLILFNAMLVYHIYFDQLFFNTCYDFLYIIINMNHRTFLLLCEYISFKISSSAIENIWVKRLFNLLKENLVHLNNNDKDYVSYLKIRGYNLTNNSSSFINEIKYYTSMNQKYIKALLKNLSDDTMTTSFSEIISNISTITTNEINDFFRKKVIRILNKNASVAGSDASLFGWGGEHEIKVPYLTNKTNKKFTLVLDLDETLICFIPNPNEESKGTLKFRPGLIDFLLAVKEKYEVITFTSATREYADPIENAIEQKNKYFDARLYRHHTIIYENDFVKDIQRIGRPLDKIIIVDNMPQNFRLQKDNGIVIKAFWGDDVYDNALISLKEILLKIVEEFNDIRKGLIKYKDEILNKVSSNCARREHIGYNS